MFNKLTSKILVKNLTASDYEIAEHPPTALWAPPIEPPKNRNEVYSIFGNPGVGSLDKKWERQNMVVAKGLPGKWNNGRGRLYCHRLAEPFIRRALKLADERGFLDEIHTLGCFNFRHQRHDPGRPLSYHSWGIALDINPKDNRGIYRHQTRVDQPFTGNWREIYPNGVSEKLVQCFKAARFSWGGDWSSYCDPMHWQICD